ncbi:MAG: hypothetical protein N3A58_04655 [Spirochaetes bacterium]|nr:hypothetical protein [Spirochaetota bacterium]
MKKKCNILFIFLVFIEFLLLTSCSRTPEATIKLYFKYLKEEKFEKIDKEILYGKSKEKFVEFLKDVTKDQNYYSEFVNYNKNISKFNFLEYQEYPDDELAIKFMIMDKSGKHLETTWWRLKKIGNKYFIIKFSKN